MSNREQDLLDLIDTALPSEATLKWKAGREIEWTENELAMWQAEAVKEGSDYTPQEIASTIATYEAKIAQLKAAYKDRFGDAE